jgi:pimeloyl-ACP methyl ester carboxylesterase
MNTYLRHIAIVFLLGSLSGLLSGCADQGEPISPKQFEELEYPYATHVAQVMDSIEVAYVDEGQGDQTLLLIHGLGSYLPAWKPVIEELKSDYRVIALDLPGYGKSAKGAYPYSMPFFAQVVRLFMEQVGIHKPVVLAHSMGGQIAMRLSLDHPESVEKLVLAAPAGFESFTEEDREFFETYMTPEAVMSSDRGDIRDNIERNFNQMSPNAEFMIRDRVAVRGADDFEQYAKANVQSVMGMLDGPVVDELDQLSVPTLIVFGEQDALIPNTYLHDLTTQQVAQAGHELIPNSQLKMIPEAGHFVHFEQPSQFNQYVRTFIAE